MENKESKKFSDINEFVDILMKHDFDLYEFSQTGDPKKMDAIENEIYSTTEKFRSYDLISPDRLVTNLCIVDIKYDPTTVELELDVFPNNEENRKLKGTVKC